MWGDSPTVGLICIPLMTARRYNQSILKEISPGCSLEGLMLKLKLQYFGNLCKELTHWKRPWCWEGLGAGGEGDDRGWDGWMTSPTQWAWVWVNPGSWWWTGRPGVLRFMASQRVRHDWAAELNWTERSVMFSIFYVFVGHQYVSLEKCLLKCPHFKIRIQIPLSTNIEICRG